MIIVYLLIGLSMLIMGATALAALFWAAREGQFSNLKEGSHIIFDEGEPIGEPTNIVWKSRAERRRQKKTHSTAPR